MIQGVGYEMDGPKTESAYHLSNCDGESSESSTLFFGFMMVDNWWRLADRSQVSPCRIE
jgi:hypothetical protein